MSLKVLHILKDTALHGSQRVALDILSGLPPEDFEKVVVTGGSPSGHEEEFHEQAARAGARVIIAPYFVRPYGLGDLVGLKELAEICRRERPDIVHTHSAKPFVIGRAAALLAGVPHMVHTVHGIAFHDQQSEVAQRLYWTLENLGAALGGTLVSVNHVYPDRFVGVAPSRWRVIPNGVDPDFGPAEAPPPPEGPKMILFPSRLSPQKDPIAFLRAAEVLLDHADFPHDTTFELAGDGPLTQDVTRYLSERSRLRERVTVHGWVNDLRPLYARAWAVCVPSRWEAFGLVVAEAALFGAPAVASDAEGLPEVIVNGETGLLSPVGDMARLAENLRRIVTDEALRTRLGAAARRRMLESFTLGDMQERHRSLYRELALSAAAS